MGLMNDGSAYDWGRAASRAQDELDNARRDAHREAVALADMLARGVETTSAFSESAERFDQLNASAHRWEAIRDAIITKRVADELG